MARDSEGRNLRGVWPNANLNNLARYRTMVLQYREAAKRAHEALASIDPRILEFLDADKAARVRVALEGLPAVDAQFVDYGELWHLQPEEIPEPVYDDDDWLRTRDAATATGVASATINAYRSRGDTVEAFYAGQNQGYIVRMGSVRELQKRMPGRGWRALEAGARPS